MLVTLVTMVVQGQGLNTGGDRGDMVASDYYDYVDNDFEEYEYDMIHGLLETGPNEIC